MTVLGFCPVADCGKMVSIEPSGELVGAFDGDRRRVWYPVPHDRPDGTPCDGHKRGHKRGIR